VPKQESNYKFAECYEAIQTALHLSCFVVYAVLPFALHCCTCAGFIIGLCVVTSSRRKQLLNYNIIITLLVLSFCSYVTVPLLTNFHKGRLSQFHRKRKGNLEGWASNHAQLSIQFATNLNTNVVSKYLTGKLRQLGLQKRRKSLYTPQ
jgi:hypothetical protein